MEKFLLEDFAGGAVAERIGSAIQRVYENIANPNMDAEKARKLTIELTFKPDKNDRTDVDVTAIVKTSLQPEKAISSRMIVESDGRGNVQGNEWRGQAFVPDEKGGFSHAEIEHVGKHCALCAEGWGRAGE